MQIITFEDIPDLIADVTCLFLTSLKELSHVKVILFWSYYAMDISVI